MHRVPLRERESFKLAYDHLRNFHVLLTSSVCVAGEYEF
jgi:hypothetical protein